MEKILGILSSLGVDETFFWMTGFFIVSYLVISTISLKPLAKILIAREQRTEGRERDIYKKKDELKDKQAAFDEQMKAAQQQGGQLMNQIKQDAQEEQRKILQGARDEAQAQVAKVRADVGQQFESEMGNVRREIPVLVEEILGHLVGVGKNKQNKEPVRARS